MARARNIKPSFFSNEDLVELPFETRLLFIGLWTLADRAGRLEDRPKRIKMAIFPADNVDVDGCLDELAQARFIQRYEARGVRCIQVTNFSKHQNPHVNEKPSDLPTPEESTQAPEQHGASTVQAPEQHGGNRADSLIPDSLIPDSLSHSAASTEPMGEKQAEAAPPSADPITSRSIELAGLLLQRGAKLTATNPEVRRWAADGVTDGEALQALEIAQQRRETKADPSPIPANYLSPILRDIRSTPPGGGARASPAELRRQKQDQWLDDLLPNHRPKKTMKDVSDERTLDATPRSLG